MNKNALEHRGVSIQQIDYYSVFYKKDLKHPISEVSP